MTEVPKEVSKYLSKIGRRGGETTGVEKGFAGMTEERRRQIAMAGVKARAAKRAAKPKKAAKKKGKAAV
ncbi:MAG: hypothetical protein ACRD3Y_02285 [Bryobacteraceae bacterium]